MLLYIIALNMLGKLRMMIYQTRFTYSLFF